MGGGGGGVVPVLLQRLQFDDTVVGLVFVFDGHPMTCS